MSRDAGSIPAASTYVASYMTACKRLFLLVLREFLKPVFARPHWQSAGIFRWIFRYEVPFRHLFSDKALSEDLSCVDSNEEILEAKCSRLLRAAGRLEA